MGLTVVVPFYNEAERLSGLLKCVPADFPVIVVDDQSPRPPVISRENTRVVKTARRGYFAGAINTGLKEVLPGDDVVIINQDSTLAPAWPARIAAAFKRYAVAGELAPARPGYPKRLHGSIFAIRADARKALGGFDAELYPHWGGPELYTMRASRAGFKVGPFENLKAWFFHEPAAMPGRSGAQTTQLFRAERGTPLYDRLRAVPPRVSVIMPVYNKKPYLEAAVDSVLQNDYQSFQLILVDDGSTDGSRELIESLVNDWSFVSAIFQAENKGVVAARNTAINAAVGELVYPFDSDDLLFQKGLERMVRAYDASPERWIYSDMEMFGHNIKTPYTRRFKEFDEPHPYDIALYNRANCAILYPRDWWLEVGGYPHACDRGIEDWCFGIALTMAGHCGQRLQSFDGNPRPAFRYRRTPDARGVGRNNRGERVHDAAMLRRVYPQIFADLEKRKSPMACCGGGRKPSRVGTPLTQTLPPPADTFGEAVWLEYIGGAIGAFFVKGQATRQRYQVIPGKPLQIYSADLRQFLQKKFKQIENPTSPAAPPQPAPPAAVLVQGVAEGRVARVQMAEAIELEEIEDPGDFTVSEALVYAEALDAANLDAFIEKEKAGKARSTLLGKLNQMMLGLVE